VPSANDPKGVDPLLIQEKHGKKSRKLLAVWKRVAFCRYFAKNGMPFLPTSF
jgi:hypothetical protein